MSQKDIIDRLHDYGAKFGQIDPEYLMCIDATAEIERLRAAQQDGGWQPIETAPTSGMTVDLWCTPSGIATGAYGRTPDCWYSAGKWWRYDEQYGDDQCRSEVANAAYWRPRPEQPA